MRLQRFTNASSDDKILFYDGKMDSCRCNASMGLMPEEKRSFHAEKAVFVRIEEVFMKRFCLLSLSLLCLLLAACGGNTPDTPAKEEPPAPVETDPGGEATDNLRPDKNTLVIAIADEVEGLDVQQIGYGNHVHTLIGEQLVAYNCRGAPGFYGALSGNQPICR